MKHEVKRLLALRQRQTLTFSEQTALEVLQMPLETLSIWVKEQIEINPLLELEQESDPAIYQNSFDEMPAEIDFEKSSFEVLLSMDETFNRSLFPHFYEDGEKTSRELPSQQTLFEYLMAQAGQILSRKELEVAEIIIGNLDERGYLTIPVREIFQDEMQALSVLRKIQTFDPPGIAAQTLRESFLLQLTALGRQATTAFKLVDHYFEDLLHRRYEKILTGLSLSPMILRQILEKEIASLKTNPISKWDKTISCPIIPDLYLHFEDEKWSVEINEELLPSFSFSTFYQQLLSSTEESYLKKQLGAGKWLKETLQRRGDTLKKIGHYLIRHQEPFLRGFVKELCPLTMRDLSLILSLHPSTITRAVSNKYLSCPAGLFPLRYFFTPAIPTQSGERISQRTLKGELQKVIAEEDKRAPLSDEHLSQSLQKMGFCCARRTVAKYRKQLRLPSARQRISMEQALK